MWIEGGEIKGVKEEGKKDKPRLDGIKRERKIRRKEGRRGSDLHIRKGEREER